MAIYAVWVASNLSTEPLKVSRRRLGKRTKAVRKKLTRSEVSGASGYEEAVRGYGVSVFSRSARMPYSLAGAVEAEVWKRDRVGSW